MFKTHAIILKKEQLRDKKIGVTIFTRDFGKIFGWYEKKGFYHDIGDIIEVYIERKGGLNYIKNTENSLLVPLENWSYERVYNFLGIIQILSQTTAEGDPNISIFDDYKHLLSTIRLGVKIETYHYNLYKFRILKSLGMASVGKTSSIVLEYIDKNILKVSIERLLNSKVIPKVDQENLKQINLHALYQF